MLPVLYQSHNFILYSYPLFMGFGWGVAYQVFFALKPKASSINQAQFLFWGCFLASWIGAKILFYLTSPLAISPDLIIQVSFWTGGGFVFYGGFIAAVLFLFIYRLFGFQIKFENLWPMLPALTFGHGVGRLGCFLAGCCYGSVTNWFWGISLHGFHRHPTQLIEALGLFLLGFYLLKMKERKDQAIAFYLISYGLLRLVVEALRGDEIRGQWGSLTPSQWISLMLVLVGVSWLFKRHFKYFRRSL